MLNNHNLQKYSKMDKQYETIIPKRKRTDLTLQMKIDLIKTAMLGYSQRKLGEKFGVSVGCVNGILKRKDEYLEQYHQQNNGEKQRSSKKKNQELINTLVWKWYELARCKNISITYEIILKKAKYFSKILGLTEFKPTKTWLSSLRSCYQIREISSSSDSDVDWIKHLDIIMKHYPLKDIFNCKEIGLFFRALPISFMLGDDIKSGHRADERVTILLCASATGERLKILVVGHNIDMQILHTQQPEKVPVNWYENNKAWMTLDIFKTWLEELDKEMRNQGRYILLLLDKSYCHPDGLQLTNIQLQFLPTYSKVQLQPLDQGIVMTFKTLYRTYFLQALLSKVNEQFGGNFDQISELISLMEAVHWINEAWNSIGNDLIQNCFYVVGIKSQSQAPSENCEEEQLIIQKLAITLKLLGEMMALEPMTPEEFVTFDDNVPITEMYSNDWEKRLFQEAAGGMKLKFRAILPKENEEVQQILSTSVSSNAVTTTTSDNSPIRENNRILQWKPHPKSKNHTIMPKILPQTLKPIVVSPPTQTPPMPPTPSIILPVSESLTITEVSPNSSVSFISPNITSPGNQSSVSVFGPFASTTTMSQAMEYVHQLKTFAAQQNIRMFQTVCELERIMNETVVEQWQQNLQQNM